MSQDLTAQDQIDLFKSQNKAINFIKTLFGASELWFKKLRTEFDKPYFLKLQDFLKTERTKGTKIYPDSKNYFEAFRLCSFDSTKVIILGQDPYHGPGQAHGLSFSVPKGLKIPPSLVNIFKELSSDLNVTIPKSGNLSSWASSGVLLLNTVLTVEAHKPASHKNLGWQLFTDKAIRLLVEDNRPKVFILWGSHAQNKKKTIDFKNHLILEAPHPSPLSSYRGFFGSRPFSKANEYLVQSNKKPIDWDLAD